MQEQFERTALLIGEDSVERLQKAHVIVFGVGGVGGFVVEALARAGIGSIDIVDNDEVKLSNINRQIIALHSTVGKAKVEVMKERIAEINPFCKVTAHQCFYLPETADQFDFSKYTYVVDAVDTVTAKLQIITAAKEAIIPVISCMGTGNKLDPSKFQIADVSKTTVCPLAKVMRRECKARGLKNVKVLYSTELPRKPEPELLKAALKKEHAEESSVQKRSLPASISFVPSVAGLMIAGEVIRDIVQMECS